ncbi:unnamed protein product [Prorocentrum cordatum]|uniref:Uncharacterized protein n=1 Tax=Prorocentrum cordatum TaxID=2364126 RepID=A0ABN9WHU2_9DINO|nr:unnamed protein product [Polarella glacialis]
MQAQIRRIDQMDPDSRLWESRHQLEEEVRAKFSEFESTTMQIDARVRTEKTATEDTLKKYNRRLQRLETLEDSVHSLTSSNEEDTRQSLEHLYGRLVDMQQQQQETLRCARTLRRPRTRRRRSSRASTWPCSRPWRAGSPRVSTSAWTRSRRNSWMSPRASRRRRSGARSSARRWTRGRSSYQRLKDRVERADWEGRLKEVSAQVKEMDQYKVFFAEQHATMDRLQKKMDFHEQSMEDLQRALKDRPPGAADAAARRARHGVGVASRAGDAGRQRRGAGGGGRAPELQRPVQLGGGETGRAGLRGPGHPGRSGAGSEGDAAGGPAEGGGRRSCAAAGEGPAGAPREGRARGGAHGPVERQGRGRGGPAGGRRRRAAGAGGGAETPRSSRAVVREVHQLLESLDLEATLKSIGSRVTKVEAATERLKVEIEGPGRVDAPSVHDD